MKEKDDLKLLIMPNCEKLGNLVHEHLKVIRNCEYDMLATTEIVRFNNSEGKAHKTANIVGQDVYIFCDVGNYSETYNMYGFENHKSYDDHFQDLKRVVSSLCLQPSRTNVIMPLLYSSRQHKRKGNESLDCGVALRELENLGVNRVITFDVHDSTVQTAMCKGPFENLYPTYSILKKLIRDEDINIDNLMIISPDNGAVDRAAYYADALNVDVGIFHKRRDYSIISKGKHPIVAHEYLGKPLDGKDILIVDDMIASGQSMIEVAENLKERGANRIYLITTFTLLSQGLSSVKVFDEAFSKNMFNKLYTTNLSYIPDEIQLKDWIEIVDCSKYIAKIIDKFNRNVDIEDLVNGSSKQKILSLAASKRHNK